MPFKPHNSLENGRYYHSLLLRRSSVAKFRWLLEGITTMATQLVLHDPHNLQYIKRAY